MRTWSRHTPVARYRPNALRMRSPSEPNRRLHHREPLRSEDLVEGTGELRVSIPEQDMPLLKASGDREVPSLLSDPGRVWPTAGTSHVDSPGGELDEEQDVERLQEHRLHREEVAGQHPLPCARRNSVQVKPLRRGAGPRPARRKIRRTVLAPTRIPTLRSSPWILAHPHRGFSVPRRVMRPTVSGSRGGRPGPRRR